MNREQTIAQSKAAYGQHKDIWRKHASENKKFDKKPLTDFSNIGVGRACLLVANGASFEREIEVIKEKQESVDILCCDKTLGHLIDNDITPTYAMVCDAKVDPDIYLEKWKDKLKDTVLFINVCASKEWVERGNWKEVYFFVNEDVLGTQNEFMQLSGSRNTVPAGTNVSNAMLVLLTQSDNKGRQNFFGYDKYILIGYDYCWTHDGNYYAFNKDGNGKHNYMRHISCKTDNGKYAFTSSNLQNSNSWGLKYINTFSLPVVNCSKTTIFCTSKKGDLAEQMEYTYQENDSERVKNNVVQLHGLKKKVAQLEQELGQIGFNHFRSFLATS